MARVPKLSRKVKHSIKRLAEIIIIALVVFHLQFGPNLIRDVLVAFALILIVNYAIDGEVNY